MIKLSDLLNELSPALLKRAGSAASKAGRVVQANKFWGAAHELEFKAKQKVKDELLAPTKPFIGKFVSFYFYPAKDGKPTQKDAIRFLHHIDDIFVDEDGYFVITFSLSRSPMVGIMGRDTPIDTRRSMGFSSYKKTFYMGDHYWSKSTYVLAGTDQAGAQLLTKLGKAISPDANITPNNFVGGEQTPIAGKSFTVAAPKGDSNAVQERMQELAGIAMESTSPTILSIMQGRDTGMARGAVGVGYKIKLSNGMVVDSDDEDLLDRYVELRSGGTKSLQQLNKMLVGKEYQIDLYPGNMGDEMSAPTSLEEDNIGELFSLAFDADQYGRKEGDPMKKVIMAISALYSDYIKRGDFKGLRRELEAKFPSLDIDEIMQHLMRRLNEDQSSALNILKSRIDGELGYNCHIAKDVNGKEYINIPNDDIWSAEVSVHVDANGDFEIVDWDYEGNGDKAATLHSVDEVITYLMKNVTQRDGVSFYNKKTNPQDDAWLSPHARFKKFGS